jgi:hypothetical protein
VSLEAATLVSDRGEEVIDSLAVALSVNAVETAALMRVTSAMAKHFLSKSIRYQTFEDSPDRFVERIGAGKYGI